MLVLLRSKRPEDSIPGVKNQVVFETLVPISVKNIIVCNSSYHCDKHRQNWVRSVTRTSTVCRASHDFLSVCITCSLSLLFLEGSFFNLLLLFYGYEYFDYIYISISHKQGTQRIEESRESPGTGVIGSYEQTCECLATKPQPSPRSTDALNH